jgi:beta-glucosidase/6-phospho-beta-glucosidase/beta-galactosidase
LLLPFKADKKSRMLKRRIPVIFAAILCVTLPWLSIAARSAAAPARADQTETDVVHTRFARLRYGISLSHWFSQSAGNNHSKEHLETHITAEDIALIKAMGFDHIRLPIEPAPLTNSNDPSSLRPEYLRYFDAALEMILAQRLAVIVDIHPSDDFKLRLKDDRQVESLTKFWRALAEHLSTRDPEMVFFETINEPIV